MTVVRMARVTPARAFLIQYVDSIEPHRTLTWDELAVFHAAVAALVNLKSNGNGSEPPHH